MAEPLLRVNNLRTILRTTHGTFNAVDNVSFSLEAGQTIGIVGESGCGKSMTALSIMGLMPARIGEVTGGTITFRGRDLRTLPESELERLRGEVPPVKLTDEIMKHLLLRISPRELPF